MEKLEQYYEEFRRITAKYNGKETEWKMYYYLLDKLYSSVRYLRIKRQKKYYFYAWVQDRLATEIRIERDRIKDFIN